MKTIPLTQGQIALVDDEDFERLNQFKWHAAKQQYTFYAKRRLKKGVLVRMHREILSVADSVLIDHRNGNGLDNQKENLRIATKSKNGQNSRKRAGTSSRFKGVAWHKKAEKWEAHVHLETKKKYLGLFSSEQDAARAYDFAARKYFGEFARLNFP